MGTVVIQRPKHVLVFDEKVFNWIMSQHQDEYIQALQRGKGYKRYQQNHNREVKKNWEAREVAESRKRTRMF